MRCRQVEDLLSAYIDDELENGERKAILEHVQACPNCQKTLNSMTVIKQALQMPGGFDVSNELAGKLGAITQHFSKAYSDSQKGEFLSRPFEGSQDMLDDTTKLQSIKVQRERKTLKQKKSHRVHAALKIASSLAVIVLSVAALQSGILTPKPAKPVINKEESKKSNTKVIHKQDLNDSRFVQPPTDSPGKRAQSFSEAVSQIAVKPKLPDANAIDEPNEIYILDAPTLQEKGIRVVYKSGISVIIRPKGKWYDFDAVIKQTPDLKPVDINGIKSFCAEPRKVSQGKDRVLKPAIIIWYEQGIEYTIQGDDTGKIGLNRLLPIARSMR
ncbi:MAG: hypothetical protein COW32_09810 [Candidatus Aquicultor secundus]|uniref:Putative zinc-finger domain-containing protein n=1 Tax=Candidatus Aquicultor secundus TaxID=1973895 RepID=A0A2M7T8N0_9ACTN|nr:zf-HC2 domain-containing protein [Candidatus Aquicultor secundus]OIO85546.1 MAG: hypothetical protein AUK32_07000 [Candidatus Aquicultor secundus]PIU27284.1 MAG: hypothetical protein COT10_04275 [Candidatus Aquicultor secundus]PIW21459.1 MAG: hypothetical protein COW32_09810 [Candidatus Aquicultor secundus]PIX52869.1 MAG: hypothetical protein COZ51_01840 [Candidatus Aquicultor secundus]PIY37946.1 MAG: hypothetical protein COZ03_09140 [Candidatus Aquicultor secundus]